MEGPETSHANNRAESSHAEKNHIKTEAPEEENERETRNFPSSFVVKNESHQEDVPLAIAPGKCHPPQQGSKNIMIQNLLSRPKPSYELVHGCIFCGVKFSNPRTLQAHLTNYCSKKPQFDLCSSSSNFLLYSFLPDHLKYNFVSSQVHSSTDVNRSISGHHLKKNNCCKATRHLDRHESRNRAEEDTRRDVKTEQDENASSDIFSRHDKNDLPDVVSTSGDDKQEVKGIFQPYSTLRSSSNSLNPPSRLSLLNCFPNFSLEILKKNYFDSHALPSFLNPFLFHPSYFLNSSKSNSDLLESSEALKNTSRVSDVFPKFPSNHSSVRSQSSTEDDPLPVLKSTKVEDPLDLSNKKEKLSVDSETIEVNSTVKSNSIDTSFNGRESASRSTELNPAELPFPLRMHPPTTNRCTECNIVFFKAENFLAHKQHYCSSRNNRIKDALNQNSNKAATKLNEKLKAVRSAEGSKVSVEEQSGSDVNNNNSNSSDMELVATLNKGVLQYYCIPCKIKFSNLETLKAHKKFYCSSRFNRTGKSPDVQGDESVEAGGEEAKESDKKVYSCSVCGVFFSSEQLLMLHFCTGMSASYQLFQCPHCDHIAQSDSRLMEHMRGHAPSKVYKCTLCGYRGNTVRGMRMHGKMHNDAGESFTDDSMLEVEEPPVIPRKNKLAGSGATPDHALFGSVLDIPDLELIRLKNEPYKRRRSRKAYEKSEYATSHNERNFCAKCDVSFPASSQFQLHVLGRVTEAKASPNSGKVESATNRKEARAASPSHRAQKRNSSASSLQDVSRPAKVLKLSPCSPGDDESTANFRLNFEKEDKQSDTDRHPSLSPSRDSFFPLEKSLKSVNASKYCKQCNINFMYTSTYLAHKKYYCTNQAEEEADISVC